MSAGQVLHVVTDTDRRGAQLAGRSLHVQLANRGWPSRLVALAPGKVGGLDVPSLGTSPLSTPTLRALRRAARDADVVIAHGSTALPACALALVAGPPFVYVNIGDPRAWLTSRARLVRTRAGLRRAAAVAAISPQSARVLTEWVGVPEAKVRVLPNFRDPERFRRLGSEEKRAVRESLHLPVDGHVVVWMGSLTPEKRPDLALDTAAALPEVHVVLAGGGPLAGSLQARADDVDVRLLGPVSEPERLLGAADALLLTSDTEGVPGVLIEAGLCGIPAASTDVGFVRDVVADGATGRLARAGDSEALAAALRDCLSNQDGWGATALERCQTNFTPQAVVPQWETLLRQAMRS